MGTDSWLLGSRCARTVTCASEVAREGRVKDGHEHAGGCFGYWKGSRARRGTGVGLGAGREWAVSVWSKGEGGAAQLGSTLEPRDRATETSVGDIGAWMITNPTGA